MRRTATAVALAVGLVLTSLASTTTTASAQAAAPVKAEDVSVTHMNALRNRGIRRDHRRERHAQILRIAHRYERDISAVAATYYAQQRAKRRARQAAFLGQQHTAVTRVSTAGMGAFEACVENAESGGVPTAWYPGHTDGSLPPRNSPVAEGLFGFLLSTWRGLGLGYSEGASFAPASVQKQGFAKEYAADGTAPWTADGCPSLDAVSATLIHTHRSRSEPLRLKALRWARSQHGKPYVYGTDGPNSYDCSGLVMWAYHHAGRAGRRLGRDTFDMLAQVGTVLRLVKHPKRGDLAFFGTGHVELWLGRWHGVYHTFGAQQPGTVVGRHRIWWGEWQPTAYYQVVR